MASLEEHRIEGVDMESLDDDERGYIKELVKNQV
jgi:hypothetical protein|tara:strand:- start:301 stop:402 length:102 start_codon:yes stop_codon:yes gene_type:complete